MDAIKITVVKDNNHETKVTLTFNNVSRSEKGLSVPSADATLGADAVNAHPLIRSIIAESGIETPMPGSLTFEQFLQTFARCGYTVEKNTTEYILRKVK